MWFLYSCATVDKMSTDIACHAELLVKFGCSCIHPLTYHIKFRMLEYTPVYAYLPNSICFVYSVTLVPREAKTPNFTVFSTSSFYGGSAQRCRDRSWMQVQVHNYELSPIQRYQDCFLFHCIDGKVPVSNFEIWTRDEHTKISNFFYPLAVYKVWAPFLRLQNMFTSDAQLRHYGCWNFGAKCAPKFKSP